MKDPKNLYEFIYTEDLLSEMPIVCVNGEIGFEVSGPQVAQELYALSAMGKKTVQVNISSYGGSVLDGMMIFDAIKQSKMEVTTVCTGVAASIASIIFLAGDKRLIVDYGSLMFHNPYNSDGSEDQGLLVIRNQLIKMISGNNKLTESKITAIMDAETWMEAEDAIKLGFADEIWDTTAKIKEEMTSVSIENKWQLANKYQNKFKQNEMRKVKNMEVVDVTVVDEINKDVVNDASDVEEAKEAVEDAEDALEEAKEELAEAQEESSEAEDGFGKNPEAMADPNCEAKDEAKNDDSEDDNTINMKNEISDLKNKLDVALNELKVFNEAKIKAEAEAKEAKIDERLNVFIKMGKIRNESKNTYKALARLDFENTMSIIEEMPVNRPGLTFKMDNVAKKEPDAQYVGDPKNFLANLAVKIEKDLTTKRNPNKSKK